MNFRVWTMPSRLADPVLAVAALLLAAVALMAAGTSHAGRISDISNTKHNLSVTGPGTTKATTESQVCVFCHTPHAAATAAELGVNAPLWNRKVSSNATYEMYDSTSMDATDMAAEPGGTSKLCLSCHDGTLALGAVGVLNGQSNQVIDMTAADPDFDGTMPGGELSNGDPAATSGFTRRLGVDLRNDHPISFTYDTALANADGELRDPAAATLTSTNGALDGSQHIRTRTTGDTRPLMPLDGGQLQCTSCHDPHIRDAGDYGGFEINAKFLRVNRFQMSPLSVVPNTSQDTGPFTNFVFNPAGKDNPLGQDGGDIICQACHDKAGYAQSAHAREEVADEIYSNSTLSGANPTSLREFFPGIRVWQASCLNCHDTHSVQGSRRLLREGIGGSGIDRTTNQINQAVIGGNADQSDSAIENTCYQCHSSDRSTLEGQTSTGFEVPDIKTDFEAQYHMPIVTEDQEVDTREVHRIADADFYEPPASLASVSAQPGAGRHVECTDCHNPHRVKKTRYFWEDPDNPSANTDQATHTHDGISAHNNLASGVLAGAYGVEPEYGTADWEPDPANWASQGYYRPDDAGNFFTFKELRGAPPLDSASAPGSVPAALIDRTQADYVTREYQVCMKCHSQFGYGDDPPALRSSADGGSGGVNGFSTPSLTPSVPETNQAMEFMAPDGSSRYGGADHTGEGTATGGNWGVENTTGNHRSWHPVVDPTGRSGSLRGGGTDISNNWTAPFNADVGTQTMYCSDCHGSDTANGTSAPNSGKPWGPHGSDNPFILKGEWNDNTGRDQQDGLCFKCHEYDAYGHPERSDNFNSGFETGRGNGHYVHNTDDKLESPIRCSWCHVAVPHGWKNKALLVNLNDVGPECQNYVDSNGDPIDFVKGKDAPTISDTEAGFSCAPYYQNAYLRVVNWAQSGSWEAADCGASSDDRGGEWMTNTCQNPL